jgi:hypothetical protein
MNKSTQHEINRILGLLLLAALLLMFVAPGLQQSPYNDF